MILVDPCVVCEKNTHAMTLTVVNEKSRHTMTPVDPCVVNEKNTNAMTLAVVHEKCYATGGSMCGL